MSHQTCTNSNKMGIKINLQHKLIDTVSGVSTDFISFYGSCSFSLSKSNPKNLDFKKLNKTAVFFHLNIKRKS